MLAFEGISVQYFFSGSGTIQMQKIRWFLLIVAILLALALSLQNNEPSEIQLLWFKQSLPLSVLLLTTGGIGFLFGALMTASMLRSRKAKAAKKAAEKAVAEPSSKPESESVPTPADQRDQPLS